MRKYNIKIGIIGGSGLDDLAKRMFHGKVANKSCDNNAFGMTSGPIYEGLIDGIPVALIARHGEGHRVNSSNVNYRANIEGLKSIGCTHILATTCCGSLTEAITPGQLVIPDSFIDRTYSRKGTLYDDSVIDYPGVCHIPMDPAFDRRTSDIFIQASRELGIEVKNGGTVVSIEGPRFSSRAESKMLQKWGGDLVNMTTCPEVFLAKEAGILYASIAMATDYDCWRVAEKTVCVVDVMQVFKDNVEKMTRIIVKAIKLIGEQNWDEDIDNLKRVIVEGLVSKNETSKKL